MQNFGKKIDVVVYTMGKVGSSTVSTSLKKANIACLDIHFWVKERILAGLASDLENSELEFIPEHLLDSILAHNALRRQGRIKVITLVRNPIMRNISAVFQNLPPSASNDFDLILQRLRNYPVRTPDYWFEKDFIPMTGIDVFGAKLARESDHFRFETDRFDVLLLKLESSDETKRRLLGEFVETPIAIRNANQASGKWYFEIYKKIFENPSLVRPTFVQECLGLKYYRAFYTDEDALKLAAEFDGANVA